MPNPLFNAIFSGSGGVQNEATNSSPSRTEEQSIAPNQPKMTNMQDAMTQLKHDPAGMIKQAGYNVPEEYVNNPQTAAMYIIQSGQVAGPLMKRIQPMLNMLMGRR